ncbi:MAG TPA: phospho-sugar mutase [Rectinemataceae bacterium]|nr:phospho-sugar mutase [Rectinemataceae bacterium]
MDHESIRKRAKAYIAAETDTAFRKEVEELLAAAEMSGDTATSAWAELEDRFYRDLEFGTGGLRGVIGGGFNRMNFLVVTRATQGLCDYLIAAFPGKKLSAVIAHDSRNHSDTFSMAAARVFAANGIKAWLFPSLRPTPELSYAVRELRADTGIVVTASHNPPKYNGYKAYWNDGSQVTPPHDVGIIDRVGKVVEAKLIAEKEAFAKGLIEILDGGMDDRYVAMVKSHLLRPALIKDMASQVKLVYTPLHGTGAMLFERIMGELGLGVVTVPEQREPDGRFPTVAFPNPEEAAALDLAIKLATREKADAVMANDPDADRLGIAVRAKDGSYTLVSGNQLGSLHLDYILLTLRELGRMPKRPATIKTIVTTDLQARIASAYGATIRECLTGFKWIAEVMRSFEREGLDFVYGTEESYGHLVETEVRDKDGISAAALTAEMVLYWRSKGKSLLDRLDDLYAEHGYYEEKGVNRYFEGASGMDIMAGIMADYRAAQPHGFGGVPVVTIRDVKTGREWATGAEAGATKIDLPPSDVLQWRLSDGTIVTVRPSGTEPKIKYYVLSRTEMGAEGLPAARKASAAKNEAILADIKATLEKAAKARP